MSWRPNLLTANWSTKIKILEKEALEYLRKEKEFNEERRRDDFGHLKRALSLM